MTLNAWTQVLREARDGWEAQAEALVGPRSNLGQADASLLGPRVAPHAEQFLDTWQQQVKALRDRADDHAGALSATMQDFIVTDADVVERTQQLLSWTDRNTPPVSA